MHNQPIPRRCRELDFTKDIHAFPFLTFNQLPSTIYQLPTFPLSKLVSQKGQANLGVTEIAFLNGLTAVHMCRGLTENNQAFNQLPGMERLSVPGSNPGSLKATYDNLENSASKPAGVCSAEAWEHS